MAEECMFRVLDLFCGAGGFSYGLHLNKHFATEVALDFNQAATTTFSNNFPLTKVFTGDITDPEIRKCVIEASRAASVNMIIGGPPCQGFAMKGKKLGLEDPRNFLFLEYLKFVDELKPEVFVIENVRQLLSSSNGWFKDQIIERIQNMGYRVSVGILNAKDFSVPQSRERAIFICSKAKDIPLPVGGGIKVTVRDAISDLAYLESGEGTFEMQYAKAPESVYQERSRCHPLGILYNHQATNHSILALKKLAMIPPEKGKEYLPEEYRGKQQYNTTWCRLIWDEISPTIDTRFDTPSNGTNSHPVLNRSITPREAARIQSFGDDFVFWGSKCEICKQIGNAVPPLLGKAIADQIYAEYKEILNRSPD